MYLDSTAFGVTENTNTQTAYTSVYGNIFRDHYYASDRGRLLVAFNEQDKIQSYTVSAGTPKFTSTGSLILSKVGDSIIYEWPHYVLGYAGFLNLPASAAGVNLTPLAGSPGNYGAHNIRYDIDKNNGSGFSGGWSTLSAQSVSAITGVSASGGFKLRLLVECVSANPSNSLTGLFITTKCTTADQQYQYPLATVAASLVISGLPDNTEVKIFDSNTSQLIAGVDNSIGGTLTYNYTWSGIDTNVFIMVHSLGYVSVRYNNQVLGQNGLSIPTLLSVDRQYFNPP